MVEEDRGRSLYWLRTLLGLPAQFASAADAARGSGPLYDSDPPRGAVVWFATVPHGNCALSLGEGRVLALTGGYPVICPLKNVWLGEFLGWTVTIGHGDGTWAGWGTQYLTDQDREELKEWVFTQTDGEVISDPDFKPFSRIVRGAQARAWERAHTTMCSTPRLCDKHRNPYQFIRA